MSAPAALAGGDALLLCTGGLLECVTDQEMEITYAESVTPDDWPRLMTPRLLAVTEPDNDNLRAMAIFVQFVIGDARAHPAGVTCA